jgi:hypothetical protein
VRRGVCDRRPADGQRGGRRIPGDRDVDLRVLPSPYGDASPDILGIDIGTSREGFAAGWGVLRGGDEGRISQVVVQNGSSVTFNLDATGWALGQLSVEVLVLPPPDAGRCRCGPPARGRIELTP